MKRNKVVIAYVLIVIVAVISLSLLTYYTVHPRCGYKPCGIRNSNNQQCEKCEKCKKGFFYWLGLAVFTLICIVIASLLGFYGYKRYKNRTISWKTDMKETFEKPAIVKRLKTDIIESSSDRVSKTPELKTDIIESSSDRVSRVSKTPELKTDIIESSSDRVSKTPELKTDIIESSSDRVSRVSKTPELKTDIIESSSDRVSRVSKTPESNVSSKSLKSQPSKTLPTREELLAKLVKNTCKTSKVGNFNEKSSDEIAIDIIQTNPQLTYDDITSGLMTIKVKQMCVADTGSCPKNECKDDADDCIPLSELKCRGIRAYTDIK